MALGAINIEVSANAARFERDFQRIASFAEAKARDMDKAFAIVATGLKAIGAGFAIGLTLDKVKDKI